jgi:hypothetical protein
LLLNSKDFSFYLKKLNHDTQSDKNESVFSKNFKKFVKDLSATSDYLQKEQALFIQLIKHNL